MWKSNSPWIVLSIMLSIGCSPALPDALSRRDAVRLQAEMECDFFIRCAMADVELGACIDQRSTAKCANDPNDCEGDYPDPDTFDACLASYEPGCPLPQPPKCYVP